MRILENLSATQLDYYGKQPTAKKLLKKTMRDGKYIPQGDKTAATAYATENGKSLRMVGDMPEDKVEISKTGWELSDKEVRISFASSRIGDSNKFRITFENSAMLHRAVKQGYLEIEGNRIDLSDDVKKQLLAKDKQLKENREHIAMQNFLMHEATNARQTSDAMKEANDKMSRAMKTASRIMHGRKVSPADEKELMEFNKDLYAMAKNAAALEKHRHRKDDKEDEKISAENDEARAREAEPKDYSVEEKPVPLDQVQMTVSLEGDVPEIVSIGEGVPN